MDLIRLGTVYDHLSWVLFRAKIKLQISIYKVTFIPNPNKAIVKVISGHDLISSLIRISSFKISFSILKRWVNSVSIKPRDNNPDVECVKGRNVLYNLTTLSNFIPLPGSKPQFGPDHKCVTEGSCSINCTPDRKVLMNLVSYILCGLTPQPQRVVSNIFRGNCVWQQNTPPWDDKFSIFIGGHIYVKFATLVTFDPSHPIFCLDIL